MEIKFNSIEPNSVVILPNRFVDEVMINTNGEYIKIYLYLLRNNIKKIDISKLADTFNIIEKDIFRVLKYFKEKDLIDFNEEKEEKVTPRDFVSLEKDEDFKFLVKIVQTYLQPTLNASDFEKLQYIHDELKFPSDLLEYLVEYCLDRDKKSIWQMEQIAIKWHKQGIKSKEDAKKILNNQVLKNILKAMGTDIENPDKQVVEYIYRWHDEYEFSEEMIMLAIGRSAVNLNKKDYKYVEGILRKWKANNIFNEKDVIESEKLYKENSIKEMQNSKKSKDRLYFPVNKFNNFSQRKEDLDSKLKNLL